MVDGSIIGVLATCIDKRHGQQALRESRCERVAMVSAGVGMCGGLRRRALTFHSGARSEIEHLPVPEMEGDSSKVKPDP